MNVFSKIVVALGSVLLAQSAAIVTAQTQTPVRLTLQDLLSIEPIGETALSPDGSTFALVRNGQIALLPAAGGWPVTLTSTQGGKSGVAWSPEGKRLAFISQGSLWTVSISGGNPLRLTNAPAGTGDPRQAADREPRWSPDGRWILFTSGRRGVNSLLVVSADGNTTSFLTKAGEESGEGRWSPDGKKIVYITRTKEHFSGRINLLNFDSHTGQPTGDPVALYTSPTDKGGGWSIRGANWSPDSQTLVTVLQNSGWDHLYLLPAKGGEPKQITHGNFDDLEPEFSPDGKTIAFISNRNLAESTSLWTVPVHGGQAHEAATFPTPGIAAEPQWSPDNKALFFHHQSARTANDLFLVDASQAADPKPLTDATPQNIFTAFQVPQRVTWKSKDRHEIPVFYTNRTHPNQAANFLQSSGSTAARKARTPFTLTVGHSSSRSRATWFSSRTIAAAQAMARPFAISTLKTRTAVKWTTLLRARNTSSRTPTLTPRASA